MAGVIKYVDKSLKLKKLDLWNIKIGDDDTKFCTTFVPKFLSIPQISGDDEGQDTGVWLVDALATNNPIERLSVLHKPKNAKHWGDNITDITTLTFLSLKGNGKRNFWKLRRKTRNHRMKLNINILMLKSQHFLLKIHR